MSKNVWIAGSKDCPITFSSIVQKLEMADHCVGHAARHAPIMPE